MKGSFGEELPERIASWPSGEVIGRLETRRKRLLLKRQEPFRISEEKKRKPQRHGDTEKKTGKTPRHQGRISGLRELGAGSRNRGFGISRQMRAAAALLEHHGKIKKRRR
jgi:hypothetical protein